MPVPTVRGPSPATPRDMRFHPFLFQLQKSLSMRNFEEIYLYFHCIHIHLCDTIIFMKSIRFIFMILVVAVAVLVVFLSIQSPPGHTPTDKNHPSFFMGAFGKGKLFRDVERKEPCQYSRDSFTDEKATLFTDHDTSLEILFSGHRLIILENSGVEINPKLNQCILIEGRAVWKKVLDKKSDILIGSPDMSFRLSDSGTLETLKGKTTISNYLSPAVLSTPEAEHTLEALTCHEFNGTALVKSHEIPSAITDIDPLIESIIIREPKDALVHFTWKTIPGISEYRFRLFGSTGMTPVLLERVVASDRLIVDLLHYDTHDHVYWDVTPVLSSQGIQGVPSKLGAIEKSGRLLNRSSALLPPSLEITSLSVSGSMVLIEGIAQPDSDLYIDSTPVKKDDDGKFIHTLSYKKMGQKTIVFRLISPAEIETIIEKNVTIFVE